MSRSDSTNPELSEQTPEPNFKSERVNASLKEEEKKVYWGVGEIYSSHVNLLF